MSRRRPYILPKRSIFVGCEGKSECSYVGLLQDLIRAMNLSIHLHIEDLGLGAGDPLAKIQLAIRKLEHLRKTRTMPAERFVMMDSDKADEKPERLNQLKILTTKYNIKVIWQNPCFEALLLRHFVAKSTSRPPNTREAERALKREWPEYEKPMARSELSMKIDLDSVLRAASTELELKDMLFCFGIIPSNPKS
jgi:hypothetical protein